MASKVVITYSSFLFIQGCPIVIFKFILAVSWQIFYVLYICGRTKFLDTKLEIFLLHCPFTPPLKTETRCCSPFTIMDHTSTYVELFTSGNSDVPVSIFLLQSEFIWCSVLVLLIGYLQLKLFYLIASGSYKKFDTVLTLKLLKPPSHLLLH